MMKFKSRKGFSTIEILIAVALVGILMAVGIPRLLDSRKTVSDSTAKQQLNTVMMAVNNFFAERDTYDGLSAAELQERLPEVEIVDATSGTGKGSSGRALKVSVKVAPTEVIMAASNGDQNCWAIKVNTSGTQYANKGGSDPVAATACTAAAAELFANWQNFEFPNIDEA
jgi:prepilin-type N-terminal cleavage/methylation domain-containing protein